MAESRRRHRKATIPAAAAVLLAVTIPLVVVGAEGSAKPSDPSSEFAFKPQSYPSGLIVDRTWTLSGADGTELHGSTTLTDGASGSIQTAYSEVLPTSVAPDVGHVHFRPAPDAVVQADPVVRYDINLGAGSSTRIAVSVDVGKTRGSRSERLALLANQQMSAEAAYFRSTNQAIPTTLASIYVTPSPATIAVGQSQKLTLSGTLNSGATAPDHLLAGAVWSSSSPSIAEVSGGIVAGLAGGTATVSAQVGSHIATLQVTVVVNSNQSSSGPESTNPPTSGSQSSSSRSQGTEVEGGGNSQATNTTTNQVTQPASPSPTADPPSSSGVARDAVGCPLTECATSPDVNGDGIVNQADVNIMDQEFGKSYPPGEIDGKTDSVTGHDLNIVLSYLNCSTANPCDLGN